MKKMNWIKMFSSNLGLKFISFLIAIVLWIVVLASRNIEVIKEVPVEVITPPDLMLAADVQDKVGFKLSGPKAFLRVIMERKEDPIRINLTGSKPGIITYRLYSDNIQLPIGIRVQSITPASLVFKLEQAKHRDIPVRLELRGVPPEGYRIQRVDVTPSLVRIMGAESRVATMTEINTLPVDVSEMKFTNQVELGLDLERHGVRLEGAAPKAMFTVLPTLSSYKIKNVDIQVLSSYHYKMETSFVSIQIKANTADIKDLDKKRISARVDLRSKQPGSHRAKVQVNLPANVTLVRVIPETVQVTLFQ